MKGKAKHTYETDEYGVEDYENDLNHRPLRYTNRSNVMDEADARKHGGKAKHKLKRKSGGKVHGHIGLKHGGRKPRAEGGHTGSERKTGSNNNPFSSAHFGKEEYHHER